MRLLFIATALIGTFFLLAAAQADPQLPLGPNADLGGRRLLPADSPWHRDISKDRVDPRSAKILGRVGLDKPLHADFGTVWEGAPIGIPYFVVSKNQRKVPVTFKDTAESDPGPYPIPPDAPIEGGPTARRPARPRARPRQLVALRDLPCVSRTGGRLEGGCGAIFDLSRTRCARTAGPRRTRRACRSSPGSSATTRSAQGAIDHALRFTVHRTRRAYRLPCAPLREQFNTEHPAADGDARAPEGRLRHRRLSPERCK